jgi:hypothetical protein
VLQQFYIAATDHWLLAQTTLVTVRMDAVAYLHAGSDSGKHTPSFCNPADGKLTYGLCNSWLCYLHVRWYYYWVLRQLLIQLAELY